MTAFMGHTVGHRAEFAAFQAKGLRLHHATGSSGHVSLKLLDHIGRRIEAAQVGQEGAVGLCPRHF